MTRSKKQQAQQPKRGVDSAWQALGPPQLPREITGLLRRYLELYGQLHANLLEAEHAAAGGTGEAEVLVSGGAHGQGALGRLWLHVDEATGEDRIAIADLLAAQLRRVHLRAARRLRSQVEALEVDLGLRAPKKGPRDSQGRLKVVSASYLPDTPEPTTRSPDPQEPASQQASGQIGDRS